MYIVQVNYFDRKGEQQEKELQAKTEKGIVSKLKRFSEKYTIYNIPYVTPNLIDYDFSKHGISEMYHEMNKLK